MSKIRLTNLTFDDGTKFIWKIDGNCKDFDEYKCLNSKNGNAIVSNNQICLSLKVWRDLVPEKIIIQNAPVTLKDVIKVMNQYYSQKVSKHIWKNINEKYPEEFAYYRKNLRFKDLDPDHIYLEGFKKKYSQKIKMFVYEPLFGS
jgi:predicted methyltransferase